MRHTIVIEVPDHLSLSADEIEDAVTGAIQDAEVVAHREIHRPFRVVEYHHEQMTEPADDEEGEVVASYRAEPDPRDRTFQIVYVNPNQAPRVVTGERFMGSSAFAPVLRLAVGEFAPRRYRTAGYKSIQRIS